MPEAEGAPPGAPPEQPNPEPTPPARTEPSETDRLKAEAESWRARARQHEDQAKANAKAAKELEQLKKQTMSEQEKAVEAARSEARSEALREMGALRVDDALRLAVTGRGLDADVLLEGLDRTRFLTSEGQPDSAAVARWVDRLAPPPKETGPTFPDLGQGARGSAASAQSLDSDPLLNDLKAKLSIR